MKLVTTRPFNFTARYSSFTREVSPTNPDVSQLVYQNPVTIKCSVVANAVGELTLYTDAMLQNDGGIGLVLNKNNELLYPIGTLAGAVWRIIEGQPLTDAWGNKNRYRYRCQMIIPQQGSVTEGPASAFQEGTWWTN